MANHELQADRTADDRWVDDRLASLSSGREWVPDTGNAFARFREQNIGKTRARRLAVRRWIVTTIAAAGAGSAVLLVPATRACAKQPAACVQSVWGTVVPAPTPVPTTPVAKKRNFREVGSASAPVTLEIYLDYDCMHCGVFLRDAVPPLIAEYVNTGKLKLFYRDYPLPTHRFAQLAARYADAAGELGYYDAVMKQLFATRAAWDQNGDIDTQVAQVLPADAMEMVREHVKSDSQLDDSLAADLAMGQGDHLNSTPFVVVVAGGKRHPIAAVPLSFEALKSTLDGLL